MRTKKLVSILAFAALLGGCNLTDVVSSSALPEGAKSVDEATAVGKFSAAIGNLGDDGSFGINLSNFDFGVNAEINAPISEKYVSSSSKMGNLTAGGSVTNASFYAGVRGLTSTAAADVAAQLSAKADIAYNMSSDIYTVGSTALNQSVSYKGVAVNAYLNDSTAYFDFNNDAFIALVNSLGTVLGSQDHSFDESSSFASAPQIVKGKYKVSDIFTKGEATFPLLNAEAVAQLKKYGETMATYLNAHKEYFDAYVYDNGNYALDLKITKEKIIALTKTASTSLFSESNEADEFQALIAKALSYVTINAAEMVIVYNESGLVSFITDIDVKAECTFGQIYHDFASAHDELYSSAYTSADLSAKESIAFNLNSKLDFLSGNDVTITLPDDLSSYTDIESTPS